MAAKLKRYLKIHAHVLILFSLVVRSFGAPELYGIGFKIGGKAETEVSTGAKVTVGNGKISGDVTGSAKGELDSFAKGGVFHESGGKIIGANGGLNGKIGGKVQGGAHGEAGLNKDGSISAGGNSTLSSTSNTGISGYANIATGDAERRYQAEYEGRTIESRGTDPGTETDLIPVLSAAIDIVDHFWLYFWVCIGCVVFITCCCLFTVCGGYWKLVSKVNSLKKEIETEKEVTQKNIASNDLKVSYDKKQTIVHMDD